MSNPHGGENASTPTYRGAAYLCRGGRPAALSASRSLAELPTREAPQRCLGAVGILDEHDTGVERLTQLRQRHPRALQELPEPPHCGALGVLGLPLTDQEGDAERVVERQRRETDEGGADRGEVALLKGLAEPCVVAALDRHERMFALVSVFPASDGFDAAYAATPERFVRRAPTPPPIPVAAWINKPDSEEVAQGVACLSQQPVRFNLTVR